MKRNMRKRIVALSLCFVLIFSGTIPVFASEKSSSDNISIERTSEESLSNTEDYEANFYQRMRIKKAQ